MVAQHGTLVGGAFSARGFYAHLWRAWCRLLSAHGAGQRGVALVPTLYTLGVKHVFTRSLVSFSLGEWGPANRTRHWRGFLFGFVTWMAETLSRSSHEFLIRAPAIYISLGFSGARSDWPVGSGEGRRMHGSLQCGSQVRARALFSLPGLCLQHGGSRDRCAWGCAWGYCCCAWGCCAWGWAFVLYS